MRDPFAAALAVLHSSVGAVAAIYQEQGQDPVSLRVIRHRGTREVTLNGTGILADVDMVQIQCGDVARPVAGASLSIGTEHFVLQGGPSLDARGLYWTCNLEPA